MYRVGVIGCRGIGVRHAQGALGLDNAAVVAACDLEQEQLDNFQEEYKDHWPQIAQYKSHREMLEKENLDIVTVATSDHRHADLVVDAAEAGAKGIFCEKPLATSLADADRMIEACERNNTILSVDHTRRWMPVWRYAKEEIVDKGVIGPVQYIVSTLAGPRAMLFRNGTHLIDAICYYAQSEPKWVMGDLETGYEDYREYKGDGGHEPSTEPGAFGYIHFANGVRGFFAGGSKNTPAPKSGTEIIGTTGRIRLVGDAASLVDPFSGEGVGNALVTGEMAARHIGKTRLGRIEPDQAVEIVVEFRQKAADLCRLLIILAGLAAHFLGDEVEAEGLRAIRRGHQVVFRIRIFGRRVLRVGGTGEGQQNAGGCGGKKLPATKKTRLGRRAVPSRIKGIQDQTILTSVTQ